MAKHLLWMWLWYFVGALAYIIKRAFYQMQPPNVVANNVPQYLKRAGVPVFFRLLVDSAVYWACFTPQIVQAGLKDVGLENSAWVVSVITQFAVAALVFGVAVDPMMDWAIGEWVPKIPIIGQLWPQMPGPLPPAAPDPPRVLPSPANP